MDFLIDWMEVDGRAVIITSHQVEDIKKLSDYLFVLKHGQVLGHFVQEDLTTGYYKYWINGPLTTHAVPGEVFREDNTIISDDPQTTEQFFKQANIAWIDRATVELEDIMTLLLSKPTV